MGYVSPKIEIKLQPDGRGTVILNGENIANWLSSISIVSRVNEGTVVTLDICLPELEGVILPDHIDVQTLSEIPKKKRQLLYEALHKVLGHRIF